MNARPHAASRSAQTVRSLALTLIALAACSKTPSNADARGDTARTIAVTDSVTRPNDVTLTAAQMSRIHIAPVTTSTFNAAVQTTGTVAFNGDRSTQVLAPVSGPITRILVNPGAYVRRGTPLATVTSPDFASAIAAFRKAQSQYRNAQRIADLDAQLFKNDAISRREVEQAQTDASGAAADLGIDKCIPRKTVVRQRRAAHESGVA